MVSIGDFALLLFICSKDVILGLMVEYIYIYIYIYIFFFFFCIVGISSVHATFT
jgi:hypothetical protein